MPDGRWLQRVVYTWNGSAYVPQTTNRFAWDGNVLLAILDHTNGLITSFMRGLDLSGTVPRFNPSIQSSSNPSIPPDGAGAGGVGGLLAATITSNGTHFAAFDGNGNVAGLVNAADGKLSAIYEYAPFGATLRETGVAAKQNPLGFGTQYKSDIAGTWKYLHRSENSATGAWLSRDPIGERLDANLYAFVQNNPITYFDLLGLFKSSKDAAFDALRRYNPISISTNLEYCGMICQNEVTGEYTYTVGGGRWQDACRPESAPCKERTNPVGDWHTHARGSGVSYFDEQPSPQDRQHCHRDFDCYLGTPSGRFMWYTKGSYPAEFEGRILPTGGGGITIDFGQVLR